jgi:hypothetical protein
MSPNRGRNFPNLPVSHNALLFPTAIFPMPVFFRKETLALAMDYCTVEVTNDMKYKATTP